MSNSLLRLLHTAYRAMLTRALKILGVAVAGQAPVWNGQQAQWQSVLLTQASQAQNTVFAAPSSANGAPTFRSLALADLPSGLALLGQPNNFGATISSAGSPNYGNNVNTEIVGATGTGYALSVTPYVAQSGTAGWAGLLVNSTVSSAGSGNQYLADFQAAGASRAHIDASGNIGCTGNLNCSYVQASGGLSIFDGDGNGNARVRTWNANQSVILGSAQTYTLGTGTNVPVLISPTYNQSGTANTIDLKILRTDTALGSGTHRFIECDDGGTQFCVTTSGTIEGVALYSLGNDISCQIQGRSFTGSNPATLLSYGTFSGSSGTQYPVKLAPIYNQAGTAGSCDLYINRTENSLGSGTHYFEFYSVGGANKYYVDHTGLIYGTAAAISGQITTYGSGGGAVINSRSGSGSNFTVYNPTGADLRFFSGAADVGILTAAGALTVAAGITSGGQTRITTSGNSTAPISLVDSQTGGLTYVIDNGYPSAGLWGVRDTTTRLCCYQGNVGVNTSAPKATFHSTGSTILGAANAAISSANMGNSQVNVWVNESTNALTFQVKYSSGTVKNGTIALA